MTRATALASLAALAACAVPHRVTVTGAEVRRHVRELRAHGSAEVAALDVTESGRTPRREVVRLDSTLDGEPLSGLLDGCPDDAATTPLGPCRIHQLEDDARELRRYDSHSAAGAGGYLAGGLVIGGFGTAVGCAIGCPEGTTAKTVSEYTVASIGVAVLGLVIGLVIACYSGATTCHD